MNEAIALVLVALAIAGHALSSFLRTPKEDNNALSSRVNSLEGRHSALEIAFTNSHARLDTNVDNLEESIKDLRKSIDNLTDKIGGTHKVRIRGRA